MTRKESAMQIDLPQDVIDRVRLRAALDRLESEVKVIRKALDALDWQDQERRAIREGIEAMNEGRVRDFDDFDREFRENNGISAGA
jgi:predicted transcriptional regulator